MKISYPRKIEGWLFCVWMVTDKYGQMIDELVRETEIVGMVELPLKTVELTECRPNNDQTGRKKVIPAE